MNMLFNNIGSLDVELGFLLSLYNIRPSQAILKREAERLRNHYAAGGSPFEFMYQMEQRFVAQKAERDAINIKRAEYKKQMEPFIEARRQERQLNKALKEEKKERKLHLKSIIKQNTKRSYKKTPPTFYIPKKRDWERENMFAWARRYKISYKNDAELKTIYDAHLAKKEQLKKEKQARIEEKKQAQEVYCKYPNGTIKQFSSVLDCINWIVDKFDLTISGAKSMIYTCIKKNKPLSNGYYFYKKTKNPPGIDYKPDGL